MVEKRRREILNAATEIFSRFGYYGAKMEDIAKKAGIGKGTIYSYFDSKEALFYEMIKHAIEEYEKGLDKALNIEATLEERLHVLCKFHGKYLSKYIDITQIIMMEREVFSKDLVKELIGEKTRLFNRVKNAVKDAIYSGELREDLDPHLASIIIIGSIGKFYGEKICYGREKLNKVDPKGLIDTMLKGLK